MNDLFRYLSGGISKSTAHPSLSKYRSLIYIRFWVVVMKKMIATVWTPLPHTMDLKVLCNLFYLILLDCKVSRNPYSLFRGAEYHRAIKEFKKDPLTYYDMNLSAQDHQTFFTCEADAGKPEYECKSIFYRLIIASDAIGLA